MEHLAQHITNGNCFAASRRLGFRKTAVGLTPFVRFRSTTFCGCRSLLRKALLRNRKTSVTCNVICHNFWLFSKMVIDKWYGI